MTYSSFATIRDEWSNRRIDDALMAALNLIWASENGITVAPHHLAAAHHLVGR